MHAYEMIKMLVKKNDAIRLSINRLFLPLMRSTVLKLEEAFLPGMSIITWTSSKTAEYFDKIEEALVAFARFIKEVL